MQIVKRIYLSFSHFVPQIPILKACQALARAKISLCMLTNREISELLEDCRKNGTLSRDILKAVEGIARCVLFLQGLRDIDDISQNVLIRFSQIWTRIDPSNSPRAYVVKLIKTEAFRHRRKVFNRKKIFIYESEIESRGRGSFDKFSLGELCPARC